MKFRVLRAVYERTGEVERVDGKLVSYERPRWLVVGPADSAEDAKRRYPPVLYGYALVMEAV